MDDQKPPRGHNRDERWLWRQAVNIVGQLPEGEDDARAVLCYARKLLDNAPKPSNA